MAEDELIRDELLEEITKYYEGYYPFETRRTLVLKNIQTDDDDDSTSCNQCYSYPCLWKTYGNPVIDLVISKVKHQNLTDIMTTGKFRGMCYNTFKDVAGANSLPYCCLNNYRLLFPNKQIFVPEPIQRELKDDEFAEVDGPVWREEGDWFFDA